MLGQHVDIIMISELRFENQYCNSDATLSFVFFLFQSLKVSQPVSTSTVPGSMLELQLIVYLVRYMKHLENGSFLFFLNKICSRLKNLHLVYSMPCTLYETLREMVPLFFLEQNIQ